MINYQKVNQALDKSVDLINKFSELNKDELIYLKASIEIKLELDKISELEK